MLRSSVFLIQSDPKKVFDARGGKREPYLDLAALCRITPKDS